MTWPVSTGPNWLFRTSARQVLRSVKNLLCGSIDIECLKGARVVGGIEKSRIAHLVEREAIISASLEGPLVVEEGLSFRGRYMRSHSCVL
jgi:hypothetical protein